MSRVRFIGLGKAGGNQNNRGNIVITAASSPSPNRDNFKLAVPPLDTTITDVMAAGPASKGMDSRKVATSSSGEMLSQCECVLACWQGEGRDE